MKNAGTALKALFNRPDTCMTFVFPMNALHARILEDLGYEVAILGAAAVIAPIAGRFDNGTLTMTESVQISKWFADSVSIPVITDADSCFGGIFQVERAVQEYIQAGVGGMLIEDQPFLTKRMGAMPGKEVLPLDEAVAKFRVASAVRKELCPDFQIIARCDALTAVNAKGLPDVIERMLAYKEAGADVLHFEGPRTLEEVHAVREAVPGPLYCTAYNLPQEITAEQGRELGLSAVVYLQTLRSQIRFMWHLYQEIRTEGYGAIDKFNATCPVEEKLLSRIRNKFLLGDLEDFERRYLGDAAIVRYAADIGSSISNNF